MFSHGWRDPQNHGLMAAPRDQTLQVSSSSNRTTSTPFCRWEKQGFRWSLWHLRRANCSPAPWFFGNTVFQGWREAFWSLLTAQTLWWRGSLTFLQPLLHSWMKYFWPPHPDRSTLPAPTVQTNLDLKFPQAANPPGCKGRSSEDKLPSYVADMTCAHTKDTTRFSSFLLLQKQSN